METAKLIGKYALGVIGMSLIFCSLFFLGFVAEAYGFYW